MSTRLQKTPEELSRIARKAAQTRRLNAAKAAEKSKPAPTVRMAVPTQPRQSPRSFADRIAAALGDQTLSATQIAEMLVADGANPKNLAAYVSSIANSNTTRICGPDGEPLRDRYGYIVKVRRFVAVQRGLYRVATPQEMQQEADLILQRDVTPESPPNISGGPKDDPTPQPGVSDGFDLRAEMRTLIRQEIRSLVREMLATRPYAESLNGKDHPMQ